MTEIVKLNRTSSVKRLKTTVSCITLSQRMDSSILIDKQVDQSPWADPEEGGVGDRGFAPLKNHQNIGFLSKKAILVRIP